MSMPRISYWLRSESLPRRDPTPAAPVGTAPGRRSGSRHRRISEPRRMEKPRSNELTGALRGASSARRWNSGNGAGRHPNQGSSRSRTQVVPELVHRNFTKPARTARTTQMRAHTIEDGKSLGTLRGMDTLMLLRRSRRPAVYSKYPHRSTSVDWNIAQGIVRRNLWPFRHTARGRMFIHTF